MRRSGRSVNGPRSALTSFLEEQGITAPRNLGYYREAPQAASEGEEEEGGTDNEQSEQDEEEDDDIQLIPSTPQEDRPMEDNPLRIPVNLKGSSKRPPPSDRSDDEGAPGPSNRPAPRKKRTTFTHCVTCNAQFNPHSLTRFLPGGKLCDTCAFESIPPTSDDAASHRRRRKGRIEKDIAILPWTEDAGPTLSLREICVRILTKHLTSIPSLDSLPPHITQRIIQLSCRHRLLTPTTLPLFLRGDLGLLRLYDCAKLPPPSLSMIPRIASDLHTLDLACAGQMDDSVLGYIARLPLVSLRLHGTFLVRDPAWSALFASLGSGLTSLALEHAARLGSDAVAALARHCPDLQDLTLRSCDLFDDAALSHLEALRSLRTLDISGSGTPVGRAGLSGGISDEGIISFLLARGSGLSSLSLADTPTLSGAILPRLRACCVRLRDLDLSGCEGLDADALEALFREGSLLWPNPPLLSLHLSRIPEVTDAVLDAAIAHSGASLHTLHLNRCTALSAAGLTPLARTLHLRDMDLSWVREVDDEMVDQLLSPRPGDDAKDTKILHLWGCCGVTELAGRHKPGRIIGRECDTL